MQTVFLFILLGVTLFLAYANGANDNFKGVATLFGSKTTNYRKALNWATVTTLAGSVCSIFLAKQLIKNFSGKGLVPDAVANTPEFLIAVALGAALTVMLATVLGFPVSTTHALTGALVGTGLVSAGSAINLSFLGQKFFLPLLLSPFVALSLSACLYTFLRLIRLKMGIGKEYCVCIGQTQRVYPASEILGTFSLRALRSPEMKVAKTGDCEQRYVGHVLGITCQRLLDILHFISAGLVSFARGLNDTPKIMGILFSLKVLGVQQGVLIVSAAMALGGLMNARKVAETMSHRITSINHGQGFTANLITAFLVIVASRWGMPVSTTHASCGSLFGIGLVSGKGNPRVISGIILSWLLTLPVSAILSSTIFHII